MSLATSPSYIALDVLNERWLPFYAKGDFDRCLAIVDEEVAAKVAPRLAPLWACIEPCNRLVIPGGEGVKSLSRVEETIDWLLARSATRSTLLVAVGGGALLDFLGFVASIYKRGIPCVYVPTTLMAMIDASIGGKTAVDYVGVKNLLGAFSLPKVVMIDPQFLSTLPQEEILSGYWELVKYGLLSSGDLWKEIKGFDPLGSIDSWLPFINRSVALKEQFVEADFTDKGLRQWLNLGHTLGHGVEGLSHIRAQESSSRVLRHGEAVAIGLVCELYLSHILLGADKSYLSDLIALMREYFSPYTFSCKHYPTILSLLHQDKKNEDDTVSIIAFKSLGQMEKVSCTDDLLKESLDFYREMFGQ